MSHAAIEQLRLIWNRENHSIPLRRCLGVEGLRGCQVKMVLGVPCFVVWVSCALPVFCSSEWFVGGSMGRDHVS